VTYLEPQIAHFEIKFEATFHVVAYSEGKYLNCKFAYVDVECNSWRVGGKTERMPGKFHILTKPTFPTKEGLCLQNSIH